jgi:hypothetical protein
MTGYVTSKFHNLAQLRPLEKEVFVRNQNWNEKVRPFDIVINPSSRCHYALAQSKSNTTHHIQHTTYHIFPNYSSDERRNRYRRDLLILRISLLNSKPLSAMSRSRMPIILGGTAAAGIGYYLYTAGGSGTAARKQAEGMAPRRSVV